MIDRHLSLQHLMDSSSIVNLLFVPTPRRRVVFKAEAVGVLGTRRVRAPKEVGGWHRLKRAVGDRWAVVIGGDRWVAPFEKMSLRR